MNPKSIPVSKSSAASPPGIATPSDLPKYAVESWEYPSEIVKIVISINIVSNYWLV